MSPLGLVLNVSSLARGDVSSTLLAGVKRLVLELSDAGEVGVLLPSLRLDECEA